MDNNSTKALWSEFLSKHSDFAFKEMPQAGYFGDTEDDANALAKLVSKADKKATSHSLLGLQLREKAMPKVGDLFIVTDWGGNAKSIVRTTSVKLMPYFSIHTEHARIEGEGDKSLEYWKKVHWDYYTRELEPFNRVPRESMIIVFEQFELLYKK